MQAETVFLETLDGVAVEADVIRTDAQKVRAIVVIGHPHPLYGGDRFNHVVQAMQSAAYAADCHSIAVDFRGVGNSGGMHDDGDSERLDLAAACELADMLEEDCPIVMTGYSFGGVVALNVSHPLIAGWIAIAPPAQMMTHSPLAAQKNGSKIVLAPEHDQFTTPAHMKEVTSTWKNTHVVELPNVDHSIGIGATDACASALQQILNSL